MPGAISPAAPDGSVLGGRGDLAGAQVAKWTMAR